MARFQIEITETHKLTIKVDAVDATDAADIVHKLVRDGEQSVQMDAAQWAATTTGYPLLLDGPLLLENDDTSPRFTHLPQGFVHGGGVGIEYLIYPLEAERGGFGIYKYPSSLMGPFSAKCAWSAPNLSVAMQIVRNDYNLEKE